MVLVQPGTLVYPGAGIDEDAAVDKDAGVDEDAGVYCGSCNMLMLDKVYLADPLAGPVRIAPQFESFYTVPI